MEQRELAIATELLDEITSWFDGDRLLAGMAGNTLSLSYQHNWKKIDIKVVSASEWDRMTAPENTETVVHSLDRELSDLESIFYMINSDSPDTLSELISERKSRINEIAIEAMTAKSMGEAMVGYKRKGAEPPLLGIQNSINAHFACICDMRFVTLSRRVALTESLFFAYQQGLLPFGWDYRVVWCLNPAKLEL